MKRILLPALPSALCLLASALWSLASPFYTYTIVAKSGDTLDGFSAQTFKTRSSRREEAHSNFGLRNSREGCRTQQQERGHPCPLRQLLVAEWGRTWMSALLVAHPGFCSCLASFGLSTPVIANSGEIVARVGNHDDSPILLNPPSLGSPQAIAGSASFTKIGQCPGLSDDGQVVAFYGDLKPDKTRQITLQNGDVVPLRNTLKATVQVA